MTIEKKVTVDLIEIVGDNIQVRTRSSMIESGAEISASFHRYVVMPGECREDEDPRVKAVCAGIHTPEVVAAYQAEQASIHVFPHLFEHPPNDVENPSLS